jgi:hypothetical protein
MQHTSAAEVELRIGADSGYKIRATKGRRVHAIFFKGRDGRMV